MPFVTPVTAIAGTAYSSADMNILGDDVIYLYNQRPLTAHVYDGTDWSPTAADGVFEDDTSAAAVVPIVPVATSTIRVQGNVRVTSNTVRTEAIKFRVKCGSAYGDNMGYLGFAAANTRIDYPINYDFVAQPAGSVGVMLSCAQAEADDAITIEDRYLVVQAIPE